MYTILIIGPSASGKTTLQEALCKDKDFAFIKTTTDRPKRAGETDDAYHFVSKKDFDAMINYGLFFEHTAYETPNGTFRYGSEFHNLIHPNLSKKHGVAVVNKDGYKKYKKFFKHTPILTVWLDIPLSVCRKRLIERGTESKEAIAVRLANDEKIKISKPDIHIKDETISTEELVSIIKDYIKAHPDKRKDIINE